MQHLPILPILIPSLVAAFIVLAVSHDKILTRIFSLLSTISLVAVGIALVWSANSQEVITYALGSWPAPFGIVLTVDRLSALMVMLTSLVGLLVLLFSIGSIDQKGKHFHPLFQFQLMGINGAFLTGDLFNLFVFFEVLLIASYGLMVHGGGTHRVKAGVQYVIFNLLGSALFLIAVGLIYSVCGTLNMADLSLKVSEVSSSNQALLHTGALLLLVVFAVKGALMPLHFWLPGTYGAAFPAVAALFALLTKVGAYSILRVYSLIFHFADIWIILGALLTLVVGSLGVIGSKKMGQMVCFAAIASMGTLFVALGQFSEASITAALYYMVHSTLATAFLFLVVHLSRENQGQLKVVGLIYFFAAIAMAGLPPLSGFIGKLFILKASINSEFSWLIWSVILSTSLLMIVGFARMGSRTFWKKTALDSDIQEEAKASLVSWISVGGFMAALIALVIFANPMIHYLTETSAQLKDPANYTKSLVPRDSFPSKGEHP